MSEKKSKFVTIGQIVIDEFEGKSYSKLRIGPRFKDGKVTNGVFLSDDQMKRAMDVLAKKDVYLFDPSEGAPQFIKKNVAVKREDIEKVEL